MSHQNPDRFELTLAAAYRARQWQWRGSSGGKHQGQAYRVALREISEGKVGKEILNRGQA